MHEPMSARSARLAATIVVLAAALLGGCGGGGGSGGGGGGPLSCSVDDQKAWLSSYFDSDYFWYALSPRPNPQSPATVAEHFDALLYTGGDARFPRDRWSQYESTESFNRFYGEGRTLGYGLSVAGLEVVGQPAMPLLVRGVDPSSPAATAGLVRGDRILSLNGRSAADLIAADDFDALTPDRAGQTLSVQWRTVDGTERSAVLVAAIHDVAPVRGARVLATPSGSLLGYVEVRNMVSQAAPAIETAFAQFRASGVRDVVLDLRYNGGGLVSSGATLASYIGGTRVAGQTYATLLYNDKRAASNESFRFATPAPASAANLGRVFVLIGRRTCSASEQVINGLRGAGIEVVAIGEGSCGKPVGSLPRADSCGTTYSIVNFESVNQANQGRYFDGFQPTCGIAEDFTQPQGSASDPLLVAARVMADGGACPAPASRAQPLAASRERTRGRSDERQDMVPR